MQSSKSLRAFAREGVNVAAVMGAGDAIGQLLIEKRALKDWDIGRTARFSALGLIVVAPILRKWYGTLETLVSKDQTPLRRGFKKMLLDQTCFAPPFTLLLSGLVPLINGEQPNKVVERVKKDYPNIMLKNYMLWPAAQVINFTFVPMQYQVIYVQFVALLWNCYVSVILNKENLE